MPYAAIWGLLNALLIAPVLAAIWLAAAQRLPRWRPSETLLLAALLTVCVALGEVLATGFLPIDRPLRVLFPWVHLAVLVAATVHLAAYRTAAAALHRRLTSRAHRLWRAVPPTARVAFIVSAFALSLAWLYAGWNAADEHDGSMYRLVTVLQPWQDGRLGRVTFSWHGSADAYPRTIELLYSWTVLCTGNTAGLRLVNWWFLLMLGLSVYVTARRLGVRRGWAALCGATAATTPLPIYLTSVLYNDVPIGALAASALALSLRPIRRPWTTSDLAAVSIALSLAASAKFSVALACGVMGFWVWVSSGRARPGWLVSTAVLALGAAAASIQYIRSWVLFDSPLWPNKVEVAGRTVFDGPISTEMFFVTAKGGWAERWSTAIYKLFQTTSQDANGSFGPLFAFVVVPAVLYWLVRCATGRASRLPGVWLLLAVFLTPLIAPQATNLRYSLIMLAAGYPLLFLLLRRATGRPARVIAAALTAFLCVNVFDWGRSIAKEVAEQVRGRISLLSPDRNFDWYQRIMWMEPGLDPGMHAVIHRLVQRGERMVYALNTLPGLLYDRDISYAIEFRSIAFMSDRKAAPATKSATEAEITRWLDSLHKDKIDVVLVYAGSIEDRALARARSAFAVVHAEPSGGRWPPTNLYRRSKP